MTSAPPPTAPQDPTPTDAQADVREGLALRRLFTLGPANGDAYVGVRVGLGALLPLLLLIVLGRLDLAPYAVFGAFAGVYSRAPGHLDRLLVQIKAAALMWVVVLGAWFAGRYLVHGSETTAGSWWLIGLTTFVAAAASVAVGFLRLRPAGSLFHIFAFAAVASIPASPGLGDAMFTTSATMMFAVLLGQVGRLRSRNRTPWQVTPAPPLDMSKAKVVWQEGLAYLIASGVAGGVALLLSGPLGMGHTYWAMVAGVVPLVGRSSRMRVVRAVHRVLGTAGGLVVMSLIVLLQPQPWVAVLLMGVLQFATETVIIRNYFWGTLFITPMALIGTSIGRRIDGSVLYDRAVETVIGVIVGLIVVEGVNWVATTRARRARTARPAAS